MQIVFSKNGYPIGKLPRADEPCYWAIKLTDATWLCELDSVTDLMAGRRPLDWTLDIVSTGDWAKIKELWLFCPPTSTSPAGSTAHLPITTPGTGFQLKVATMDSTMAESRRNVQAQVIGRVMNDRGDCECFIFDYGMGSMIARWKSNIYRFGSWREGIAPLGALALPVLGIHLPTLA